MKVSLNLAQYYSNVDLKSVPLEEMVQRVGLQLGAVESVKEYAPLYEHIVVVKVVECEKHPNADKLSVCRIDDGRVTSNVERGEDGLVQVVCGAPNVRAGLWAVWIPPLATVPSTRDTDPFVLEAREIRGKLSNGMLASPQELDLYDSHDGILEIIPEEVGREPQQGEPISSFFGLDDIVIDCENKMFTHRPDCFGNLGVARELAAINGLAFQSPEWYLKTPEFEPRNELSILVKNDIPHLVPRFVAVIMSNVTVGKSPVWLQSLLKRIGIKPINNVVDMSNFVMHLTGQPTHAFDYDKLVQHSDSVSLFPRMGKKGEKLTLLGQKEIELTGEEMVISTDKKAVALAGIMGGAETEVDETTKTIVIECATFDMYAIRRTSMRYGLFTDAVTRFNKGQSPLQNDKVLSKLVELLNDVSGAVQSSDVYDLASDQTEKMIERYAVNDTVTLSTDFVNARLGTEFGLDQIAELLQLVEMTVSTDEVSGNFEVTAPYWRTDIEIAEDIVEEIGRLYGYDRLPVNLPLRSSKPAVRNARLEFMRDIRHKLKEAGANEVLTYSFVHGDLLKRTGTDPDKWAYHVRNAISPELQYYRTGLVPSLLAKIRQNIKMQAGRDDNEFALFEIGKAHIKGDVEEDSNLPKEMRRLTLVFAADGKAAKNYVGSPYYQAKKYLDVVTGGHATYLPLDTNEYPITSAFQQGRAAIVLVDEHMLGVIGEFTHSVKSHLKLPEFCAGFELDLDLLQDYVLSSKYLPLSPFPASHQDITLEIAEDMSWSHVEQLLHAELSVAKAELGYIYQIEPLDIYHAEGADKKRLSFRIELTHQERTLTTEEVNLLLTNIAKAAHENLDATRI